MLLISPCYDKVLAGGVDTLGQIADASGVDAEPGFWVCFAPFGGSGGAPLPLWWLLIWQGDEQFGTAGAVPCKEKQGIPGCRRGLCGRRCFCSERFGGG